MEAVEERSAPDTTRVPTRTPITSVDIDGMKITPGPDGEWPSTGRVGGGDSGSCFIESGPGHHGLL